MKIDSIFFEKKNRQYLNGVFCALKKRKKKERKRNPIW